MEIIKWSHLKPLQPSTTHPAKWTSSTFLLTSRPASWSSEAGLTTAPRSTFGTKKRNRSGNFTFFFSYIAYQFPSSRSREGLVRYWRKRCAWKLALCFASVKPRNKNTVLCRLAGLKDTFRCEKALGGQMPHLVGPELWCGAHRCWPFRVLHVRGVGHLGRSCPAEREALHVLWWTLSRYHLQHYHAPEDALLHRQPDYPLHGDLIPHGPGILFAVRLGRESQPLHLHPALAHCLLPATGRSGH